MGMEGYYFGRFQPPLIKHGLLCQEIVQPEQDLRLTVGVADSGFGKTRNNFLSGHEVVMLFISMLADLKISNIANVIPVRIYPDRPLAESLDSFFNSQPNTKTTRVVYSGSPSTQKACEELRDKHGLKIVQLNDDDLSGPRSRQVREGLLTGDNSWEELVSPTVREYLKHPSMTELMQQLDSGLKRPWTQVS